MNGNNCQIFVKNFQNLLIFSIICCILKVHPKKFKIFLNLLQKQLTIFFFSDNMSKLPQKRQVNSSILVGNTCFGYTRISNSTKFLRK